MSDSDFTARDGAKAACRPETIGPNEAGLSALRWLMDFGAPLDRNIVAWGLRGAENIIKRQREEIDGQHSAKIMRAALERIGRACGGNTQHPDGDTARFYTGYNSGLGHCKAIAAQALVDCREETASPQVGTSPEPLSPAVKSP